MCARAGCQRDRRRIGATSPESGDVLGILRNTLETRHDWNGALGQSLADPPGGNIDDPRGTMSRVGNQPRLRSGITARLGAQVIDRHCEHRHGDPLASGQEHVEFSTRRQR